MAKLKEFLFKAVTYTAAFLTIIFLFSIIMSIFIEGSPIIMHNLGPLPLKAESDKYTLPWQIAEYPNTVTIYCEINLDGIPASAEDRVAAFVGSECRGTATIYPQDDYAYADLDIYFNPGKKEEVVLFVVYEQQNGTVYEAAFSNVIKAGEVVSEPDYRFPVDIIKPIVYPADWKITEYENYTSAWLKVTLNGKPAPLGYEVAAFVYDECRAWTAISSPKGFVHLNIAGDVNEPVNFVMRNPETGKLKPFKFHTHTRPGSEIGYPPQKPVILQIFGRIADFVAKPVWHPTQEPGKFGILALIIGSLLATLGALLIAIPFGVGSAIYISEIAHPQVREIIKPVIELLAGIPSVVYGLFGMAFLSPALMKWFNIDTGLNVLNASIILGIMVIPIISSMSEDALSSVPKNLRLASFALGANRWETIIRVVLPAAKTGVIGSILLGFGRAIGETMVVIMVAGGSPQIPSSFFQPVRPMTAAIASEMGETAIGTDHFHALFGIAIILFIITFITNLISEFAFYKQKHK